MSQSGFFDLAKRPFGALSKMVGRVVLAGAIASAAFAAPAFAASNYANPKYSGIVVDAKTGKIFTARMPTNCAIPRLSPR